MLCGSHEGPTHRTAQLAYSCSCTCSDRDDNSSHTSTGTVCLHETTHQTQTPKIYPLLTTLVCASCVTVVEITVVFVPGCTWLWPWLRQICHPDTSGNSGSSKISDRISDLAHFKKWRCGAKHLLITPLPHKIQVAIVDHKMGVLWPGGV